MPRVVIDTNVFVAAAYNERSASRRILDAVACGELTLVVSPAVEREYRRILPRAIRSPAARDGLLRQIDTAQRGEPAENTPGTADRDDDKFVAAALAGAADAIISNDVHLLAVKDDVEVPVLRPGEFWQQFHGEDA